MLLGLERKLVMLFGYWILTIWGAGLNRFA